MFSWKSTELSKTPEHKTQIKQEMCQSSKENSSTACLKFGHTGLNGLGYQKFWCLPISKRFQTILRYQKAWWYSMLRSTTIKKLVHSHLVTSQHCLASFGDTNQTLMRLRPAITLPCQIKKVWNPWRGNKFH